MLVQMGHRPQKCFLKQSKTRNLRKGEGKQATASPRGGLVEGRPSGDLTMTRAVRVDPMGQRSPPTENI